MLSVSRLTNLLGCSWNSTPKKAGALCTALSAIGSVGLTYHLVVQRTKATNKPDGGEQRLNVDQESKLQKKLGSLVHNEYSDLFDGNAPMGWVSLEQRHDLDFNNWNFAVDRDSQTAPDWLTFAGLKNCIRQISSPKNATGNSDNAAIHIEVDRVLNLSKLKDRRFVIASSRCTDPIIADHTILAPAAWKSDDEFLRLVVGFKKQADACFKKGKSMALVCDPQEIGRAGTLIEAYLIAEQIESCMHPDPWGIALEMRKNRTEFYGSQEQFFLLYRFAKQYRFF